VPLVNLNVDTVAPAGSTASALVIADDTGIRGDRITAKNKELQFTGTVQAGTAVLEIYKGPSEFDADAAYTNTFLTTSMVGLGITLPVGKTLADIQLSGGLMDGASIGPYLGNAFRFGSTTNQWIIAAFDGVNTKMVRIELSIDANQQFFAKAIDARWKTSNSGYNTTDVNAAWNSPTSTQSLAQAATGNGYGVVRIYGGYGDSVLVGHGIVKGGTYIFNTGTTALANGNHFYQTRAIDHAGNISIVGALQPVTIDAIAPVVPTIGIISADAADITGGYGTNNQVTRTTNYITISGTGEPGSRLSIFNDVNDDGLLNPGESYLNLYSKGTVNDTNPLQKTPPSN
jgi:hypothetical protein